MTLQDPRLSFTVHLAPRRPYGEPPPWPALLERIGMAPVLAAVDPIEQVLGGPFPRAVLLREQAEDGHRRLLAGLGRSVAASVTVTQPGEVKGDLPVDALRAAAIARLLGDDIAAEDLEPALLRVLGADPAWRLVGITELVGAIEEGVPPDLPEGQGMASLGPVQLARAVGVGDGHVAWQAIGYYIGETERLVVTHRLHLLGDGYKSLVPSLLEYGGEALRFGRAARRAQRQDSALQELLEHVRDAVSWAVSGGPPNSSEPPQLARLLAQLEALRAMLMEQIQDLMDASVGLRRGAEHLRTYGAILADGPFPEASIKGNQLLDRLRLQEQAARRWAEALELAARI